MTNFDKSMKLVNIIFLKTINKSGITCAHTHTQKKGGVNSKTAKLLSYYTAKS